MKFKGLFIVIGVILLWSCANKPQSPKAYQYNEGAIFGTFYHIQYDYDEDLLAEINAALTEVDWSLSTYKSESVLSKVNLNKAVQLDPHFITVFNRSMEISEQTKGAFDITVTSLVNAWGFGFKKSEFPDSLTIDSLMQFVGYKNVKLQSDSIHKSHPHFMLDASAIAKGYGVDVVADILETHNISNYLVEIGGEIRLKGKSSKDKAWSVGIDKPVEGLYDEQNRIQDIISLQSGAIATSGDYRQFYYRDNKKYSHTINPKTGFPVTHGIFSASVYTKDCMSADAYATAFMVMGPEKVKAFSLTHPELGIYIIYANEKEENSVWMNDTFSKLINK